MHRFAANLSMMFNEVAFLDRFEAAAAAGFTAVEFLFPYDFKPAEIADRLRSCGLSLVLFNMPPGDWAAGERGLACLPGRQADFRDGVARALDYAAALDCKLLHCMAGIPPAQQNQAASASLYAANLAWASEQALAAGRRVVIEAINGRDMPGYHLATTGQAASIVQALGTDRLGLQFDIYHCQITEGDLTRRLEALMPVIAHVQVADVPDRHEPGSGEIAWGHVFATLDRLGYAGWVGCEYRPAAATVDGLAWRARFGVE